jgi:hypothetical protein
MSVTVKDIAMLKDGDEVPCDRDQMIQLLALEIIRLKIQVEELKRQE